MQPSRKSSYSTTYPTDVSDEEWAFVAPYLTLASEDAAQRRHDLRRVFNALKWILRAGAPWRMLPHDFPPWQIVYQQARRWLAAGVFEAMVHDLRVLLRDFAGRNKRPSAAILDSRTLQSTPESGHRAGYDGAKSVLGSGSEEWSGLLHHKASESEEVQAGQDGGEAFVIFGEASASGGPGEGAFDDPAAGQQHEAAARFGMLDDDQLNAMRLCGGGRVGAGVALVDKGDFDALAGGGLDGAGEALDLRPVLFVRRGDVRRQELAERVDGEVQLRALLALGAVVACAVAAFGRRTQGAAVEDRRRRVGRAAGGQAQKRPEIVDHHLEYACKEPPPRLLVDSLPRESRAASCARKRLRARPSAGR
jgi:transposase